MKRAGLLVAISLAAGASACYNDRDTLGFELRNRPDVQRALTGRFERNPPLYYEMRVARLRAQPRLTAAEHDDLAVALDRLGRSDEALAALDPHVLRTSDDRYRYFANRGTIEAHRWIRQSAEPEDLLQLKRAEADIGRAMAINPKAHFGREAVQLELLRWLEHPQWETYDPSLGNWLREKVKNVDPVVGLAGLIELGGAWESPDVALAIAQLTGGKDSFSTQELAYDRYDELHRSGRASLSPVTEEGADSIRSELGKTPPAGEPPVAESFRKLRAEADAWNKARTDFMLARLRAGRHPDTDPAFWNGWQDRPMPRLDPTRRMKASEVQAIELFVFLIGSLLVVVGLAWGLTRRVTRWSERRQA